MMKEINSTELIWDELDTVQEEQAVQQTLPPDFEKGITKDELMVAIRAGIKEMFK